MKSAFDQIRVSGLGRAKARAVARRAKQLGLTPEGYVKQLVEEDLAVSEAARTKTFKELLGPGREVDEGELDAIVDKARTEHQQRQARKKR